MTIQYLLSNNECVYRRRDGEYHQQKNNKDAVQEYNGAKVVGKDKQGEASANEQKGREGCGRRDILPRAD